MDPPELLAPGCAAAGGGEGGSRRTSVVPHGLLGGLFAAAQPTDGAQAPRTSRCWQELRTRPSRVTAGPRGRGRARVGVICAETRVTGGARALIGGPAGSGGRREAGGRSVDGGSGRKGRRDGGLEGDLPNSVSSATAALRVRGVPLTPVRKASARCHARPPRRGAGRRPASASASGSGAGGPRGWRKGQGGAVVWLRVARAGPRSVRTRRAVWGGIGEPAFACKRCVSRRAPSSPRDVRRPGPARTCRGDGLGPQPAGGTLPTAVSDKRGAER